MESHVAEIVSMTDFARRLADHVNRVAYRGETFRVVRGGRPVAELRPARTGRSLSELPSLAASLPRLASEQVTEFARDLEAARADLVRRAFRDPWAT
jgi:antitoxin (DNA-binding transcriptional repressor) of toxin-antitoxin stability system